MPLAPFRALADVSQRGYLSATLLTYQSIISVLLSVGLAMRGFGLPGQFLAPVVASLPYYVVLVWDGLRRHPEVINGQIVVDHKEHVRSLWTMSWPNLVNNLAGKLSLYSDPQILAIILGPAAVTPFVLSQKAISLLGSQVGAIGNASWAGLIDLHYKGMHERFADRLIQLTRFTTLAGGTLLTPVAAWNHEIIGLWVGADSYAGALVTWLSAANTWILGVLTLWGWPLLAGGFVRAVIPCQVLYTAVNIGISICATAIWGILGPMLGTTVSLVCISLWWTPLLVSQNFSVSFTQLIWAAVRPGLVVVSYAAVLGLFASSVPPFPPDAARYVKWTCLIFWLALGGLAFLPFAWWIALPSSDRSEWSPKFKDMLGLGLPT